MITALIDGDWILYAAGFAGQKTKYVCPNAAGAQEFGTLTELKAHDGWADDGSPIYSRIVLDPPEHIFHSAKNMLKTACNRIKEKFGYYVHPVVLIDGDGNFRSRLATIAPYKGTRSVHAKPLMYNDLREYLLTAWDAEVVYDQETDDEMAIRQGKDTIIVSIDKDMLQVPGWHYNPNKGFKHISSAEGELRLYVQAATGDTVDNIKGVYKIGPKKARAEFDVGMSELEKWSRLVCLYDASIDRYGSDHYRGLAAHEAALENMRLVYLRREPGELWTPPTLRS